jgi:glycosyltransferase involved in cell wall biosynthesis
MPRVLQIINRLNIGGPTYIAAYLTAYLDDEFETKLVAGMKDDSEESSDFIVREMGIEPVFIEHMHREINFTNDREAYRQIAQIIREFKPDIVHTHAAKAGTLGRLAAWRNKVPVILHTFHGHVFHSYFGPVKTRLFIYIERFLARISSGIIAISEEQKRELADVFTICAPDKVFVVPLGIDLGRFFERMDEKRASFRKTYHLADDTLAVGMIGRIVPVKNHTLFLQSWKKVLEQSTVKIHAFMIGDGEDREKIELLCTELGLIYNVGEENKLGATVTFTSWIMDIERGVAGMDIVALTSLNEGTPVSLIEAQAAGKPIVSTVVGGIANIVIPGKTALLSDSNDVEGFTTNLLALVSDPALRAGMQVEGPDFAQSKFGYQRLVKDTQVLYKELLKSKR